MAGWREGAGGGRRGWGRGEGAGEGRGMGGSGSGSGGGSGDRAAAAAAAAAAATSAADSFAAACDGPRAVTARACVLVDSSGEAVEQLARGRSVNVPLTGSHSVCPVPVWLRVGPNVGVQRCATCCPHCHAVPVADGRSG